MHMKVNRKARVRDIIQCLCENITLEEFIDLFPRIDDEKGYITIINDRQGREAEEFETLEDTENWVSGAMYDAKADDEEISAVVAKVLRKEELE